MKRLFRFLFSGYFVSAALIILEVLLMFFIILELSAYYIYFFIAALAVGFAAVLTVVNANYNPEYKVTWLVIIFMLPIFGTLLFVLFRRKKMSHKDAKKSRKIIKELAKYDDGENAFDELKAYSLGAAGQAKAVLRDSPTSAVYSNTRSEFFSRGEQMYESMLRDLESARDFIFLEYFIVEGGVMWDGIHEILKRKVAAGVEIRFLYDDVGSMSKLPRGFARRLRSEGIACMCFGKVSPKVSSAHNNRDHRKFLIIDGRVAYTGGINIADEYINAISRFGYWKDGGIRVEGDCVNGFTKMFLHTWDMTAGVFSDYEKYLTRRDEYKVEGDGGFYLPFGTGPSPIYPRHVGERVFLDAINRAEQYIYIATPYLIIDYDLTDALRGAALRGVDVKIITPGIPDKKLVKLLTKSSYHYLMEAGVKIYEYVPGFIHEKTVITDDKYAVVGTINFDYRSLIHHYEDAVCIFNSPTLDTIKTEYILTLKDSVRMTRTKARLKVGEWIIRCLVRLFAPLL